MERCEYRPRAGSPRAFRWLLLALVIGAGCRLPQRLASWFGRDVEGPRAVMNGGWIEPDILADDRWAEVIVQPDAPVDPQRPRWRHPTLEDLYARPDYSRPDLTPHLSHKDPVVVANAAIGLSRWGDARAVEPLLKTVAAPQLSLRQRRAAIEALADLREPSPVPRLRELLQQYGHYPPTGRMTYVPELHQELLIALGRHVDAVDDGCFQEALLNPNVEIRAQALAVWSNSRCPELPLEVVDLRADPQGRIRAAVITAVAARKHPSTIEYARQGLADFELVVRQSAVAALAAYGGSDAQAELRKVLLDDSELLRAEAVTALGQLGARDAVLQAADDASWRVRKSVAAALARFADRESAGQLARYVSDPSAEVRDAALLALDQWPLAEAGPILLAALEAPAYEARKQATAQLARRWPAARLLSADLPTDRKPAVISQLRQQWTMEFGQIDIAMLNHATQPPAGGIQQASATRPLGPLADNPAPATMLEAAPRELTPQQLAWLAQVLPQLPASLSAETERSPAVVALEGLGPQWVDVLELYVVAHGQVLPEMLYRDMLPRRWPEFTLVDALRSDDAEERRRQMARLADRARTAPLRPLVIDRLASLGATEADGLVWRSMLNAVDGQAIEPALRLTIAGLSHPSPEVRRQAIESLGQRRDPRHAPLLLPALADPHVVVQREAVRALAHAGMLRDGTPLMPMLASRDRVLRVEAAKGLVHMGSPEGIAALERQAADTDQEVRRLAAVAMGESGQAAFVPTLIRLLDDTQGQGVRRAALEALPKIVGTDVALVPGEPLPSQVDRITAWRRWWERQG